MSNSPPDLFVLSNGLRVVVHPVRDRSAVGVAMHYGVGFRSEPVGRSGFAHLFEHMMFQGSANVARGGHYTTCQHSGGAANGSTHQDYTDYYQIVPSVALDRILFLEADRMRSLRITLESLQTQVAVVQEEIRLNVLNKPYGGFPWTVLPGVLYDSFPNAHNGYGDLADIARATVAECEEFFSSHYTPGNAVLTVCGDADPERVMEAVERHFGGIPSAPGAPQPDLSEPFLAGESRAVHLDAHAPLPATAFGYRMPDPATRLTEYVAHMALCQILTGSRTARLKTKLLHRAVPLATDVSSGCGLFGPLQARDPDTFLVVATHPADPSGSDRIAEELDSELDDIARFGLREGELARAIAMSISATHRNRDSLLSLTRQTGACALLFDRAALPRDLPGVLASITDADIARAAASLTPDSRARVALTPTGERA
ncbi:pitrilysin family protein [Streptomyces sp. NBC_00212]|uniref:M16 family metallopeptidase n=1 Tax=Streptomyces sp. NBC_00212 TaxID=2975684 RepID=UPI002F90C914